MSKKFIFNWFVAFILVLFTFTAGKANISVNILLILILPYVTFLILTNINTALQILQKDIVFTSFFIIIFLSILWSQVQFISIILFLKIFVYTFFAIYLVLKLDIYRFLKIIKIFFGFCMLASIIGAIFFPSYFTHHELGFVGDWKGIFTHKNALGSISVYSLATFLYFVLIEKQKNISNVFFLIISLVNLFYSNSTSAILLTLVIITVLSVIKVINILRQIDIFLLLSSITYVSIIVFISFFIISIYYVSILNFLGKDVTLSGRTRIYNFVISFIDDPFHFFFGYGIGGFWNSSYGEYISNNMGFLLTSSHSGVLDTLVDYGFFATILIIIHIIWNIIKSFKLISRNKIFGYWFAIITILTIIYNITDSRLLNSVGIYWFLYVYTSFAIIKNNKKDRVN